MLGSRNGFGNESFICELIPNSDSTPSINVDIITTQFKALSPFSLFHSAIRRTFLQKKKALRLPLYYHHPVIVNFPLCETIFGSDGSFGSLSGILFPVKSLKVLFCRYIFKSSINEI